MDWIESRLLKRADGVIVLSEYTRQLLMERHPLASQKVYLVPAGVDCNKFNIDTPKQVAIQAIGEDSQKIILLTVRNLVPRMGLENLISAMQEVIRSFPNIVLFIGGEGPMKNKLNSQIQELNLSSYVKLLGHIPEPSLPLYYRAATCFILPTVQLEGFGLVTLEALASGTPVLGTPVGGTVEILANLSKEYLFDHTRRITVTFFGFSFLVRMLKSE